MIATPYLFSFSLLFDRVCLLRVIIHVHAHTDTQSLSGIIRKYSRFIQDIFWVSLPSLLYSITGYCLLSASRLLIFLSFCFCLPYKYFTLIIPPSQPLPSPRLVSSLFCSVVSFVIKCVGYPGLCHPSAFLFLFLS